MSKLGKHTSMDKELKRSINRLEDYKCVAKIVLGITESCRHAYAPGTLRYKMDAPGGIKINGYTGKGVVDIYVKIEPIEDKAKLIAIIDKK
jgi:hypothetical protein